MGTGAISPGVKQLGHEIDHSSQLSAEIKNALMYTSNVPYIFMARAKLGTRTPLSFYLFLKTITF
jgi:hypothetical protein